MGITINGLETRFQKPKGGENPFKSAKPFDDNIDYNSLEDGDLFYIEQKEGWKEVNYGEGCSRTMPANVIQSLPEYIDKGTLSYAIFDNFSFDVNVDEFFQFDFTPYIKLWIENPFISKPDSVSVGAFILPKYESPYSIEDIPLFLDKDQLKKFSEKLPTINLGQVHVTFNQYGGVNDFTDSGFLHNCIIGNKILQIRINNNELLFDLLDITEDTQKPVRSMVPIHFLAQYNSYDFFSVGNSITVNHYTAYKEEDNSYYTFQIDTEFGSISKDDYANHMNNALINIYWGKDRNIPHISSIIDQYLYYLKNDVKYYQYVRPEKVYIIYNNGVFSSLDMRNYNIINAKAYLSIIEYFENNPDSNMIFTTSELIKLFNIKPIVGKGLIALSINSDSYCMYTTFDTGFFIQYIDGDHVKIKLAGGYSNSSSSQELQIGEFEE